MKKSNRELISELLKIPLQEMKGESIQEILDGVPDERAMMIKEVALRYRSF